MITSLLSYCVYKNNIDSAYYNDGTIKPVESISKVMFKALSEQLGYQFEAEKAEEGEIKLFQNSL